MQIDSNKTRWLFGIVILLLAVACGPERLVQSSLQFEDSPYAQVFPQCVADSTEGGAFSGFAINENDGAIHSFIYDDKAISGTMMNCPESLILISEYSSPELANVSLEEVRNEKLYRLVEYEHIFNEANWSPERKFVAFADRYTDTGSGDSYVTLSIVVQVGNLIIEYERDSDFDASENSGREFFETLQLLRDNTLLLVRKLEAEIQYQSNISEASEKMLKLEAERMYQDAVAAERSETGSYSKDSIKQLERALEMDPNHWYVMHILAWTYSTDPEYLIDDSFKTLALEYGLQVFDQLGKRDIYMYEILGAALYANGDFIGGDWYFDQAIEKSGPGDQRLYFMESKKKVRGLHDVLQ